MRLTISTPLTILADIPDVAHVRAEDSSGAFGVLPGHADFLTVLATSVVSWRDRHGGEHHAALRGGVFEVRAGRDVSIATREAVLGDDLERLESDILAKFRREAEQDRAARADAQRLYLAALKRIIGYLRADRRSGPPGPSVGEARP
jgi:F-type H+-transporting ATPase subunit epsilon